MAGLVPATHAVQCAWAAGDEETSRSLAATLTHRAWMPGTSPAMTASHCYIYYHF